MSIEERIIALLKVTDVEELYQWALAYPEQIDLVVETPGSMERDVADWFDDNMAWLVSIAKIHADSSRTNVRPPSGYMTISILNIIWTVINTDSYYHTVLQLGS